MSTVLESEDALWEDYIHPSIVLLQNQTLPLKMSKATIHKQTPYGVFVLFKSSYNQWEKKRTFQTWNVCIPHYTVFSLQALQNVRWWHEIAQIRVCLGLKGTEMIVSSPDCNSSACNIHRHSCCGFTLGSRCDLHRKRFPGCRWNCI